MMGLPANQVLEATELEAVSLSTPLDGLRLAGLAPGRYVFGPPPEPMRLSVIRNGEPPAGNSGSFCLGQWHNRLTKPISKELVYLKDAAHLGQACLVDPEGRLFPGSTIRDRKAAPGDVLVRKGGRLVLSRPVAIDEVIGEPVLWLGFATGQFGHFLLDFVSRFWAVAWAKSQGLRFAVYSPKRRFLPFQTDIFAAFGLRAQDFIFISGPAQFRELFVPFPLYSLHHGAHPDFVPLCGHLAERILANAGTTGLSNGGFDRIYLSRRMWTERRILVNESEVEALLAEYDFRILYPEQMPLAEQIRVLRSASHIAAPIGSQTYLSLFQARPVSTLVLAPSTFAFPDDAIIGALRQASVHYFLGRPVDPAAARPRYHDFEVNIRQLKQLLDSYCSARSRGGGPG
jgi:capsular polysaccharide biosynthesis protein